jgi:acetate---CoA ligase (ADP-forming)
MSSEKESSYPAQYETNVVLKDGSVILIRPVKKEDAQAWLDFYNRLSQRTVYLRLQYIPTEMSLEDALRFCTVDYVNSFAFVAEAIEEQQKRIVAIGRYSRLPNEKNAEIAFTIEDRYQENGIGTGLMECLANVATNNEIDTFEAFVLPENKTMLTVFQDYGFHIKKVVENNILHITFPLTKTPEVEKKKAERSLNATMNSLKHIFKPRSVAVIGATSKPGVIGNRTFTTMLHSGFCGAVYPVSVSSPSVMAVKAYPSVLDIPGEVDLAIIVVPAPHVLKVVDECGRKKVRGIIVISDGFKERGEEGAALERRLRQTAFGYGMRIIGPNCMGIINTDPEVNLNATFSRTNPLKGELAFVSQSGGIGHAVLEYAKHMDIGFSSYASIGNRADIGPIDLLQYWEQDSATKVILLYLESFPDPELFSSISKRVSLSKPVLAIKGGSTPAGSRASMSHTGSMATSDIVADALFREAGIVRVKTINELFETAVLLASQPVPKGRRVAITTNAGGPGILAADACAYNGLKLPELSADTIKKLKTVVKRDIGMNNPLDLTAGTLPIEFAEIIKILSEDPNYDAILSIYTLPTDVDIVPIEEMFDKLAPIIRQNGKSFLVCFTGQTWMKGMKTSDGHFIPYYVFAENAALALANAAKYGELKNQDAGSLPEFSDIDQEKGRQIVRTIMKRSSERPLWMSPEDMNELFKCYGIRIAETLVAETADEASKLAAKISFPVVVKLNSSTISHKTEVGGVILDVNSEQEAKDAFNEIKARLVKIGREGEMQGVTVQHMVTTGQEVIVGVAEDPSLGHVMMFGLGGIYAELIKDTAVTLHPLTDRTASDLINSVKMAKLLKGYRGSEPLDIKSLEDLLLRLSVMIEDIPQIAEMDMNPVKVLRDGEGYWVVDSRIMIK